MIDFGSLPPEINSGRIYAGPGSASLVAAASAWNGIAAELNATALSYDKVVTALSGEEWLGPASASMAAAVQPYVAWMGRTAAQAEHTASQIQAAAAAYETALASVVPPPLIAANRAQLSQAMATNLLGQNNGIIAQLEAQYAEFWAQSASAMYSYAGQSALAAKVTPYKAAPQVANPAAGGGPAPKPENILNNLPNYLHALSSPTATASFMTQFQNSNPLLTELWFIISGQSTLPNNIGTLVNGYNSYSALWYNTEGLPYFSVGMGNFGIQIAKSTGGLGGAAPAAAAAVPKNLPALGGLLGGGAPAAAASASAHLGGATSIGKLSVPATWTAQTAPMVSHATAVPVSTVSAAPEGAAGPGNLLGGMPLAGAGAGTGAGAGPRYGFKPTVMARPPLGG